MGIAELGHAGLHVEDLDTMRDFYARVLGLIVTDEAPELGATFLSSRPDIEHHEMVLAKGRTAARDVRLINQISWRVADLPSLQSLYRAILDYGSPIRMVITHGNAIGVYFSDPEGNPNEIYWQTGIDVPQPFGKPIDLTMSAGEIIAENERLIAEGGQAH
ncbi:catechol-2,3-dioxygenase [Sphingopyxis panaciterrae]|uniref:VOC family protein n=1 Tax=Sphingopyxis panaciterrae TaxID=363841 RepID=UPI0014241BE8|nr:VOC family protein [Sphingopyxis panaciterrae]NIJ35943.1 catechol-2,3-dioxygenase [Sphingopyxis panaciterrae]